MPSATESNLELRIWQALEREELSASHDKWHLSRVLDFSKQLQLVYGGDSDVIVAASLLHDLGRSDKHLHGQESADKSALSARLILEDLGLDQEKIDATLLAIEQHDKPEVSPTSVEGKILKDADFLSGFGAWGILRTAMWTAESGGDISRVLDRLNRGMLARLNNLEFSESTLQGRSEYSFVNLFLSNLRKGANLDVPPQNGYYVIFEGISGSGKDSQAAILASRLASKGTSPILVREPTDGYQHFRRQLASSNHDPTIQMFLLLADRYQLMQSVIRPAILRGDVIISVRSFLSTLVYQEDGFYDIAELVYLHRFVPQPTIVILLDLDGHLAFERCRLRSLSNTQALGMHENIDAFRVHRQRYLALPGMLRTHDIVVIDASRPVDEVAEQVWEAISTHIPELRDGDSPNL